MLRKTFLLIISLLMVFINSSNGQVTFEWAKSMGGTSTDEGYFITVDILGNVYTTGSFQGTVDFDPGLGTFNLTSSGTFDIFISKLNANGDFVWAKRMGGADTDYGTSIAIDALGNVYTTGEFHGTADFDPGSGVYNLTSAGISDHFVSKLDASGGFLWAKRMGGSSYDHGNSIAVDVLGNVYTAGQFHNTADFDPGAGIFNLTSSGQQEVFISKLDANGNFLWAKSFDGPTSNLCYSMVLDDAANVYCTGNFTGVVDFDPDSAVNFYLTSSGLGDIYIAKLDANGNFVWAKKMGGIDMEFGNSIKVDSSGNVYTTGSYQGTTDFDPGVDTFNLTSEGLHDIFISKLDSNGNFLWTKSIGGTNNESGQSIAVDAIGNVYCTGYFNGTADFDPHPSGYFNLTSTGLDDIFISKLDANGNFVWAGRLGEAGTDRAYSIFTDTLGNIYLTGYFSGTTDFNPGAGTFNLTSTGGKDVFVCKLSQVNVGLHELTTHFDYHIYPNPTNGFFTLEINQNSSSAIEVKIYNLLGELVYSETSKNQVGITKRQIDIAAFSKGMYLVQVEAGEIRVSKKVVYR